MIDLNPNHLATVERILDGHVPESEVRAFGSRATWTAKDYSDLDLAIVGSGPLDRRTLGRLKEAFEDSELPIRVDVLDWHSISESFREVIKRDYVIVQDGANGRRVAFTVTSGAWSETPFSQAVEVNPTVRLRRGAVYPFVDMASVNPDSRITLSAEEREFKGSGSRFQSGDTLMARITPCLENGKIARYQAIGDNLEAHGSTEFIVIRGRLGVTDNDFAYYLTQWKEVRNYAIGQMTGTSGRQRVPVDCLDHLQILLPPISEQRAIAHVLGALDDKIELNRRSNETLEAMARAVFQDWFVDFGPVRAKLEGREPYLPPELWDLFPDRLVDSELGEIPEGWEVKALGEVIDVVGGTTPSTKISDYWEGGTHCWATPKDLSILRSPVILDTERKVTNIGLARIPSGLLPAGTLLLSSRAPIGYLAICQMPVAINQGFIAVPPGKAVSNHFMLHWSQVFHDEIVNHANGSTFLEISKSNFRKIGFVMPHERVLAQFDARVQSLFERIVTNERESCALAAQRDALLPKLVSGAMRLDTYTRPRVS
ncbi:MAG: restriction endonuclease subunit S [Chloroflexota bacterium]|nr:restriction endonuclease subunit S [Chloroflexota bacterium]